MPFTIRSPSAAEWRLYRDLRLRSLADSPDAFGSTLAREQAWPDDVWSGRLSPSALDLPLVAEVDGAPIGLAWGRIEADTPDTASVYQMWVAAEHRGAGAARLLLDAIVAWARARGASRVTLGVSCGESAANRLYRRAGFVPSGRPEPLRPGSAVLAQPMVLVLGETPPDG